MVFCEKCKFLIWGEGRKCSDSPGAPPDLNTALTLIMSTFFL